MGLSERLLNRSRHFIRFSCNYISFLFFIYSTEYYSRKYVN